MPLVSKTGVNAAASNADDRKTIVRLLNAARTGVDVAFRSLTLDTLMVRGQTTINLLKLATLVATKGVTVTGGLTTDSLTDTGAASIGGDLTIGNSGTGQLIHLNGQNSSMLLTASFPGLVGSYNPHAPIMVQSNTTVITTATGGIFVPFNIAFPNALFMVIGTNGDSGTGNVTWATQTTAGMSLSGANWVAFANSNIPLNGANERLNWFAIGN